MRWQHSANLWFLVFALMLFGCARSPIEEPMTPQPAIETVLVVVTATASIETIPSPVETETTLPPVCESDAQTQQCTLPVADVRDKYCVQKTPYTLMTFASGTTFEVQTKGFTCTDEGIRGGDQMVSCYGPELYSFDLKVCNSSCIPLGTVFEQGACQSGFGYDAEQKCCLRLPTLDANCTTIRVDLPACP